MYRSESIARVLCERNAALYCRVASKDDVAAQWQEQTLRSFAGGQGFTNVSVYTDNGYSGLGLARPALNRLDRDIAAGLIDTVIVTELSRISRNYFELHEWINRIRSNEASLISVEDGITNDHFEKKDLLFHVYVKYLEGLNNQPA